MTSKNTVKKIKTDITSNIDSILVLKKLTSELEKFNDEMNELNKKLSTLIELNKEPIEFNETLKDLNTTIIRLDNSVKGFTNKIDMFMRQINAQMRKWDILINEIKRLSTILQTSVEEVNEYIKNPLFEDIEDENALKLAVFLWHNVKLGYTEFPEEIIMSKLNMTPTELKQAIDYLKEKGWKIEEIIYSEEE